jgi:hypothetical protein
MLVPVHLPLVVALGLADGLAGTPEAWAVDAALRALPLAGQEAPGLGSVRRLVAFDPESGAGSTVRVRFRQLVDGVPVFRGDHEVTLWPDGTPLAHRLGEVADPGRPGPFVLTPAAAVEVALRAVGGAGATPVDAAGEDGAWVLHDVAGQPDPVRVVATIVPRGPTAAWRVELATPGDPAERWCILVDATAGTVVDRLSLTREVAARGRVYPQGFLGGDVVTDFTDDETVLDAASPLGWVAADLTEGNNAFAEEDRLADMSTTAGLRAQGTGSPVAFDFPVTGAPLDDLEAALTNAFWATNEAHDRFHALGFDERSGACQTANFGRGGVGNDRTRVYVQYAAGPDATGIRNTSTASTGTDGGTNTLTFGLWDTSGTIKDGALDTGLIFHEYTHLVVNRLVGYDATCDDGTQPAGLAEGWADYFAASFTGDTVIGAYVSGEVTRGLRTRAVDQGRYTYANLCSVAGEYCSRNENGEIWAGTLWDLRRAFIVAHGPEEGSWRCDRLIVEGMKMTPCRPTYVQARDGLLAADLALSGGVDRCLVWGALAGRGLGASSWSAGPDDTRPFFAFDRPLDCTGRATVAFSQDRYGDDADAGILLADATAGTAARTLRVVASSGDAEDVAAPGPGPVRQATLRLLAGPAVPGDGVLQVTAGDAISVTCGTCPGSPADDAAISRALAVRVLTHRVTSGSCDTDSVSDFPFPELSGLLDAGEWATLTLTLGNAEPFPLEDVEVTVRSDNAELQVLPTAPVPVGFVRAGSAVPWPFPVVLRALVGPGPTFGDAATLTVDVSARGLFGSISVTVPLAADYQADRALQAWGGVETFEPSSPTAAAWTHAPAGGQPADAWDLRGCGDGGGTAMTYTGPGCSDYADTPSAATLVSPPLFDFSGNVQVVHPTGFRWRNDVQLGYEASTGYCDSEMVLVHVTDNPARPRYDDPLADRGSATQYWVQWPGLSVTRNTAGWADGVPARAINTGTIAGMSPRNVRLYWVFFTDVYNPQTSGACDVGRPDAVGGGYALDGVSFTYDAVRLVPPAATTCARTCGVRAVLTVSPAGGARCPGDPLALSGELSEAAGCPGGVLEYRFQGPGGYDTGYTPSPVAMATAAPAASWTLRVRCVADRACDESVTVADPTLDESMAGRVSPWSLRVRRDGDDVVLSWAGTRSPVAYAVFRADADPADGAGRLLALADLALDPPGDTMRNGSPAATWHGDVGAARSGARLLAYRVFGRAPCAGTAMSR